MRMQWMKTESTIVLFYVIMFLYIFNLLIYSLLCLISISESIEQLTIHRIHKYIFDRTNHWGTVLFHLLNAMRTYLSVCGDGEICSNNFAFCLISESKRGPSFLESSRKSSTQPILAPVCPNRANIVSLLNPVAIWMKYVPCTGSRIWLNICWTLKCCDI